MNINSSPTPHSAYVVMLDVVILFLAVGIGFLIGSFFAFVFDITTRKILIILILCISLCIGVSTYFRFKYARENTCFRASVLATIVFILSWYIEGYYSGASLRESLLSQWLMLIALVLIVPIIVGTKLAISTSK